MLVRHVGLGGMRIISAANIIKMTIFCVFLVPPSLTSGLTTLVFCLSGFSLALGCDHPTVHMIEMNYSEPPSSMLIWGGLAPELG